MKQVVTSYTDNGSEIVYVSDHKNESNIIYMGFLVHSDRVGKSWWLNGMASVIIIADRERSVVSLNVASRFQKNSSVAAERLALKSAKGSWPPHSRLTHIAFPADCWAFIKLWLIIDIKLNEAFNLLTNDIDQLMGRMLNYSSTWILKSEQRKVHERKSLRDSLALNK